MSASWPSLAYPDWGPCCDTVHALTQILGKLAAAVAPPEPQLQHTALRLTARGWETAPLPAPDGSGAFVAALDLRRHRAVVEHSASAGSAAEIELEGRSVGEVTVDVLTAVRRLAGEVAFNPAPQEVAWTIPLDADDEHHHYRPDQVARYLAAATRASLVLGELRAPYRGRSSPVNAWWGAFDLAVSLFSGQPAPPPAADFIHRTMDAQEVAVGWWPGDATTPIAAFYAYAFPAPDGYEHATLEPTGARWDADLGEFVLDWATVVAADDPHAAGLGFGRSAFRHAAAAGDWNPELAATITPGSPTADDAS